MCESLRINYCNTNQGWEPPVGRQQGGGLELGVGGGHGQAVAQEEGGREDGGGERQVKRRLSLTGETISICRLERQEGRLREEAATTAASYETQLSVMSEHLAR